MNYVDGKIYSLMHVVGSCSMDILSLTAILCETQNNRPVKNKGYNCSEEVYSVYSNTTVVMLTMWHCPFIIE